MRKLWDNRPPLGGGTLTQSLKAKGRSRRQELAGLASIPTPNSNLRNRPLAAMEIVYRAVKDLQPPKRNVRKVSESHVREVAATVAHSGVLIPILIDDDGNIIDGVVRMEAARLLGIDQVPCIIVSHLNPDQRRLLRLALNRMQEKGEWDIDELKIEFDELSIDNDLTIETTGFSFPEIDQVRQDPEPASVEVGPLTPSEGEPTAEVGDLFILGRHRLAVGDAKDPTNLSRLMGSASARCVLTDQPYNVPIFGNVTRGAHREFVQASGEMTPAEFLQFTVGWISASLPHLIEGGVLGTFIDWRGLSTVLDAAIAQHLRQLNLIVWAKLNAGMGSLYRSQHELLPLFVKGNGTHPNNVQLGRTGRWRSNVWNYPGASSFGSDARVGLQDHPTVKPVAMLADAILDLTNPDDVVLDPFLGSGSTLLACEQTGRVCYGVELDPRYADVILRRFEASTGMSATLESTGETFAKLRVRRSSPESDQ